METDALKYLGLLFEAGTKVIFGIFYFGIPTLAIISVAASRRKKLCNVIHVTGDAVCQTRSSVRIRVK